jgi:hypothetical protein
MRKLNLHLEALVVESFSTTDAARERGTVRGMDSVTVDQDTCVTCALSCATCGGTCPNTCPMTCGNTCATCPVSCSPANCPSADGRC